MPGTKNQNISSNNDFGFDGDEAICQYYKQ